MTPSPVVALIGDSHVEGLQAPLKDALDTRGLRLKTVHHRGWSTVRFEKEGDVAGTVRAMGALHLVVVILGTNDWGRGWTEDAADAYKRAVSAVAAAAHASGAPLVWVGPPAVTSEKIALGVDRVAEAQLDVLGPAWRDGRLMTAEAPFRSDGVHLTAPGYAQWAEAIIAATGLPPESPPPSPSPSKAPKKTPEPKKKGARRRRS